MRTLKSGQRRTSPTKEASTTGTAAGFTLHAQIRDYGTQGTKPQPAENASWVEQRPPTAARTDISFPPTAPQGLAPGLLLTRKRWQNRDRNRP